MALPAQLKTARMSNATRGDAIDDGVGLLESALADILGFTVDVDITASPFNLTNDGKVGKALVAQRAAGPVGWRFRDTTSGKEVRLCVNGTNFDIDENTGSEGSPSWVNRFRMAVADGALTGAVATSSRMGLCPQGDGNTAHFLNGNLGYTTPAAATPPAVGVTHSTSQNVLTATETVLSFNTETYDTDGMHSTVSNTGRLTATETAKFIVIGGAQFAVSAVGNVRRLSIRKNGTTVFARQTMAPSSVAQVLQVRGLLSLAAGDYVELQAYQDSGSTLAIASAATYSPIFQAVRVG